MKKSVRVRVSFYEDIVDAHQEGKFYWRVQPRVSVGDWKLNSAEIKELTEEGKKLIQKKFKSKKVQLKVK